MKLYYHGQHKNIISSIPLVLIRGRGLKNKVDKLEIPILAIMKPPFHPLKRG
jgi:hypothetical protein